MKTFSDFKQQLSEASIAGSTVFQKKIDGIDVKITKEGSKFIAFIDGDKLDAYSSQKEAENMVSQFIKQYKGN